MNYDFTTLAPREGTGACCYVDMRKQNPDVPEGIVPLTIADMNFVTAPEIIAGLKSYLDQTVLGYTDPTDRYYDAVLSWQQKRHGWEPKQEWCVTAPGVVPALFHLVRAATKPGEQILMMTPAYPPFFDASATDGRVRVESRLLEQDGRYEIDFADLEAKAAQPETTAMILCSPHNPVGRIWTRQELGRVVEICLKHEVFLIADEIHNDLILPGQEYHSMGTFPEALDHCAICTAPSKTFNLAGLKDSNLFIPNQEIREKFIAELNHSHILNLNALAYQACRIAYTQCENWLEELLTVIDGNRRLTEDFIQQNLPEIRVSPMQATYLMWLDFRALGLDHQELDRFLQRNYLFFNGGHIFGEEGRGFVRVNLALPALVLQQTLERLKNAVDNLKKSK